jgi:serine/threonine protein kinase
MAEPGSKKLGRYELREIIGRGGMADVYKAFDPQMQRVVALKVFKREEEAMIKRFVREAELMSKLHHPHLVQIYDAGEAVVTGVERLYIVMPLLPGGTLRERISRRPLGLDEVARCLQDIAGALDYIHSLGIVHRDIKASNVLLDDDGRCFLTDFGIARVSYETTQVTNSGEVLGTANYIAPELFEVHRKADARSDFYSLGVLLYEMVTGRLPFTADNQLALLAMHVNKPVPSPRQYVPDLSRAVEQVLYKALEKRPELRYHSASELARAFSSAVAVESTGDDSDSDTLITPDYVAMDSSHIGHALTNTLLQEQRLEAAAAQIPQTPTRLHLQKLDQKQDETPVQQVLTPPEGMKFKAKPETSRKVKLWVALALVTLLLLSFPITYLTLNNLAHAKQQATATPVNTVTGQTPVDLTATAYAQATSTAHAQASATVAVLTTAISGTPVYSDGLTNANAANTSAAGWDQSGQCSFASDGYHVTQAAGVTANFQGCRETNNTYQNFALSVNTILNSGHSGGIYFRVSTNLLGHYDGYLFEFDGQGNYKISRQQGTAINTIQDWTASAFLNSGYGRQNQFAMVIRGSTFLFYANQHFLSSVQNSYYGDANTVGFMVSTDAGGSDAEVVFTNLKIYQA